jgi:uncharacterized protein YegL
MSQMHEHGTQDIAPIAEVATALAGKGVLHVIFILDRSGSMSGKEEDVIGGFNSYIEQLRTNPEGHVGISYVRFDNDAELVWNDVPLADVPAMTHDTYAVRGSTALLDAVGMTVSAVRENAEHNYIVITNTDGEENASREWTAEAVKALIEKYSAKDNWTFAFFGDGVEAWSQARDYGYAASASMAYASHQTRDMYDAKARVSNYMRRNRMRKSERFAEATRAAIEDADISDEALGAVLEGADDAKA